MKVYSLLLCLFLYPTLDAQQYHETDQIFCECDQSIEPITIQELLLAFIQILDNINLLENLDSESQKITSQVIQLLTTLINSLAESMPHCIVDSNSCSVDAIRRNVKTAALLRRCGGRQQNHKPIDNLDALLQPDAHMCNHGDDGMTDLVLTTFASMVGNFAAITADPRNPKVVGPNAINMLAGVLTIAKQAFRSAHAHSYTFSTQFAQVFTDIVVEQSLALRIRRFQRMSL